MSPNESGGAVIPGDRFQPRPAAPTGDAPALPRPDLLAPVAAVFTRLARLRGARVFHPRGHSYDATFTDAGLLPGSGTSTAVVRVSKAVPTPAGWPDVLGIAVRLRGPVDLLFATTGDRPGLRHLLMPRGGFLNGIYTTLLPYEIAGEQRLVALRPLRTGAPVGTDLDSFDHALPVTFTVLSAPLTGGWRRCGELHVHTRRAADVPWFDVHEHSLPGLRPAGPLQSLRRRAYRGSRAGRAHPRTDHREEGGAEHSAANTPRA